MKRFFRIFSMVAVSLFVAQNSFSAQQPTVIVIDSKHNASVDASSTDLIKSGVKKLGKEVLNATMGVVAVASAWSAGRQYQLARLEGWSALFTHPDSWPHFMATNYPRFCLVAGVAGSSYIGYKLYCYFATKKAQTPKAGMVDSETQTSLLV